MTSFPLSGRVNLQKKVQIRVAYMNEKNLIPGLPSSRPPHSEQEPQVYYALTRALGARFSKVPIINGPGKLSPFTLKIEVSIVLHLT